MYSLLAGVNLSHCFSAELLRTSTKANLGSQRQRKEAQHSADYSEPPSAPPAMSCYGPPMDDDEDEDYHFSMPASSHGVPSGGGGGRPPSDDDDDYNYFGGFQFGSAGSSQSTSAGSSQSGRASSNHSNQQPLIKPGVKARSVNQSNFKPTSHLSRRLHTMKGGAGSSSTELSSPVTNDIEHTPSKDTMSCPYSFGSGGDEWQDDDSGLCIEATGPSQLEPTIGRSHHCFIGCTPSSATVVTNTYPRAVSLFSEEGQKATDMVRCDEW